MLSIGWNCRPAISLRNNHLRDCSAPLDWMGCSLDSVLHLYRDKFRDFFTEYELDSVNPKGARGMLRVIDPRNHLLSIHHFPDNQPIEATYPSFIKTMRSRAERLESRLQNSSSIVLVSDYNDPKEKIVAFLRSFSEIYPHLRIRLLNVRHDETMPYDRYEQELVFEDDHLSFLEFRFNDTEQGVDFKEGNSAIWSKILADYRTPYFIYTSEEWLRFREKNRTVVICGTGHLCNAILAWLNRIGVSVDGIAVTSLNDCPDEVNGINVRMYSSFETDTAVIMGIENRSEAVESAKCLRSHGYNNIAYVDRNMNLVNR